MQLVKNASFMVSSIALGSVLGYGAAYVMCLGLIQVIRFAVML